MNFALRRLTELCKTNRLGKRSFGSFSKGSNVNSKVTRHWTHWNVPRMVPYSYIDFLIIDNIEGHTYIQKRSIFIRTEPTPNPDSIKFLPDDPILKPGQFAEFRSAMEAVRSPLAKILFRVDGVKMVFLGYDFISITKEESYSWSELKPIIYSELMEFFTTDQTILLDEVPVSDTTILPDDSETVAMIKELIETRIRPSVQDDGGDITYKGFIDNVVFVMLHGSCSGCPSSSVTLKNGIERMLMHWIPEVSGVVAVESDEDFQRLTSNTVE